MPKGVLVSLIGLVALSIAGAVYAGLAIVEKVPINTTIFFGMLGGLTLSNAWFLFVAWKRREQLSALVHVGLIIWGSVSAWYWIFAPMYYLLTMNLNAQQLAWTMFAFLWEVPVIGGGILVSLGIFLMRPIIRASQEGHATTDSLAVYKKAIQYPSKIGWSLFLFSVVGYLIGAWQLQQFAHISSFELAKSVSNGVVIGIFLGVFFYMVFNTYLDSYRRKISRWVLDKNSHVRSLQLRLAIVITAVMIGGVGLLGLIVVQSWQRLQEDRLIAELAETIPELGQIPIEDYQALDELAQGPNARVQHVAAADIDRLEISKETREVLRTRENGVVRDLYKEGKMIAFASRGSEGIVVSITRLQDFYGFIHDKIVLGYAAGTLVVLLLTIGVLFFVVYEITRSLISLREFAKSPSVAKWGQLVGVHTGDEIELVAQNFLNYVRKAEEADETRRDFVSIASHQLRTPLTTIQWYIEILLSERDGKLNEQQRHDLQRIMHGSKRMTGLVNSLLNVSRIDSGRLAINPTEVDIVALVERLLAELKPQIQQAKCEVIFTKEIDAGKVWVDTLIMRQVVHNLITNAIKYRDKKRQCRIEITVRKEQDGEYAIIVSDTGVGIPENEKHKVFEKFWRAGNVTTLDTEGTGLGLYVSKMLLDAAGARISFISQEDVGTTFQITIGPEGMKAKPGEVGLSATDTVE